ncbi:hypothetical protein BC833DRAFT_618716 [Globomyces pollinis-pini]|nr:hypothetical protein BC833DRAFT_618716 [Globomyces pollinis-pini]
MNSNNQNQQGKSNKQNAKGNANTKDNRRKIFKYTLDSPFVYQWPTINEKQASDIISELKLIVSKNSNCKSNVILGLQNVTNTLQKMINNKDKSLIKCVFVCKGDASPPQLYQHLPTLAYLAGSIMICPLPAGSEMIIAKLFGLKRALAFAITNLESFNMVSNLVEGMISPPKIDWIDPATISYCPANIKTVEILAPVSKKTQKAKVEVSKNSSSDTKEHSTQKNPTEEKSAKGANLQYESKNGHPGNSSSNKNQSSKRKSDTFNNNNKKSKLNKDIS